MADWTRHKIAAIDEVEAQYVELALASRETRFSVDAWARIGQMWSDFVDDFRRIPIPDQWNADEAIRTAFRQAIDAASEPYKANRARPAMARCRDIANAQNYADDLSRLCEGWLRRS